MAWSFLLLAIFHGCPTNGKVWSVLICHFICHDVKYLIQVFLIDVPIIFCRVNFSNMENFSEHVLSIVVVCHVHVYVVDF